MYGNLSSAIDKTVVAPALASHGEKKVLGENWIKDDFQKTKKTDDNFQKCSLFPLDPSSIAEFMPVRKKGYADTKIWSGSSVVVDVDSGTLLHYENGRKRTQIASLTKMMTAILAVENIEDLDKEDIIITGEALNVPGTVVGCPTSVFCNGNRMYKGEKVKAVDLFKAMLLNSANDAATALGIHIAGSAEKFVQMMNEKAKSLGLKDTNFCTPSGLEIDGKEDQCYSSAYDIARIAVASLKYDVIWDTMKITDGRFYSTDGKYMHELKNTDILLGDISNCLGGKTGFTPLAGKSLLLGVTDASRKHRVIAVILNDENRWEDMRSLVNWTFNNYDWK
jgi:D-alanyl-D-alanine carboxypeptidase (penicillin-binding protein 5/6)